MLKAGREASRLILRRVSKMDNTFAPHDAAGRSVWGHTDGAVPTHPLRDSGIAADGDGMKTFSVECPEHAENRLAQPQGFGEHGVEHGCEITGRGI
jgi:hypothetical protein